MIITYTIDQMNFPTLEVSEDMELENLLALILLENPRLNGIDRNQLYMINDGARTFFNDENMKKKLKDVGIQNNSLFYIGKAEIHRNQGLSSRAGSSGQSSSNESQAEKIARLVRGISVPGQKKKPTTADQIKAIDTLSNQEQFLKFARNMFHQCGDKLGQLRFKDEYPKALQQYNKEPTNFDAFKRALIEDRKEFIRKLALTADPTSAEGQKVIEDLIRQEAHRQQYEQAMKEMPESFIRSHMLYIKVKVNGVDTIAFIDSGAQVTVISKEQAEKFGLTHKIDKSFATIIRGVGGEQASAGRIHSADIILNGHAIQAPFTVLDRIGEDILIGLDTLRRNNGIIDLKKNCLIFGEVEVPFLNEKEYADECKKCGIKANLPPNYLDPLKPEEVDDGKVAHLIEMGYTTEEAASALAKAHNDLPTAAQIIDTERQEALAESTREQLSDKKEEPMEQ